MPDCGRTKPEASVGGVKNVASLGSESPFGFAKKRIVSVQANEMANHEIDFIASVFRVE